MPALRYVFDRPWLSLLLLVFAVQAPFWFEPYGVHEINLGAFMGTYVRNWEAHGWWELRGAPLGVTLLEDPSRSDPYFNHPAGLSWLFYLVGGAEWAVRATLTAFAWFAAVALHGLLRPRLDHFAAWTGAAALTVVPLFGFHAAASYEVTLVACGLATMWGMDRIARNEGNRLANLMMIGLACLAGPWLDWTYGLWCVAFAIFAVSFRYPPGGASAAIRWIRALIPAAVPAAISLAGVLVWLDWSKSAPYLERWRRAQEGKPEGISALIENTILTDRPSFEKWFSDCFDIWVEGCTLPGLVIAILGLAVVFRRLPTLWVALGVPVLLHTVMFAKYATFHPMQHGHGAAAFAAAIAGTVFGCRSIGPRAAMLTTPQLVAGVTLALMSVSLVEHKLHNRTDVFRDEGRVLSEAAGIGDDTYIVVHNWQFYGAYVDNRRVSAYPLNNPIHLQAGIDALPPVRGVRLLRLDFGDGPEVPVHLIDHPLLTTWLEQYPYEEHPELEGQIPLPGIGDFLTVRSAQLYTLREPAR
ncbi:MAG: hypothetical protein AAF196_13635 [Planctomycetota bacterium]